MILRGLSVRNIHLWKVGAWVAQSVGCPTLARVMISRFLGSGSALTARSLEPTSDSVSPSLPAPAPFAFCLSHNLSLTLSQK